MNMPAAPMLNGAQIWAGGDIEQTQKWHDTITALEKTFGDQQKKQNIFQDLVAEQTDQTAQIIVQLIKKHRISIADGTNLLANMRIISPASYIAELDTRVIDMEDFKTVFNAFQKIGTDTAATELKNLTLKSYRGNSNYLTESLIALNDFPKAQDIHFTPAVQQAARELARELLKPQQLLRQLKVHIGNDEEKAQSFSQKLEEVDKLGLLGNVKLQPIFDEVRALEPLTLENIGTITEPIRERLSFAAFSI